MYELYERQRQNKTEGLIQKALSCNPETKDTLTWIFLYSKHFCSHAKLAAHSFPHKSQPPG